MPSPPPLAGVWAFQGSSALDEGAMGGARREKKREGVGSWRCWGDGRALAVPWPLAAEHSNSGFGKQKALLLQKQTWCNTVPMLGG